MGGIELYDETIARAVVGNVRRGQWHTRRETLVLLICGTSFVLDYAKDYRGEAGSDG